MDGCYTYLCNMGSVYPLSIKYIIIYNIYVSMKIFNRIVLLISFCSFSLGVVVIGSNLA